MNPVFVSLGKNISSSQKTCTSTLVYDKMGYYELSVKN